MTNFKNAYYNILDTLFLPLLMLLVTPVFISKLGIEQYGLWMLINSLIVAMSILNIGGVDTVIKYISQYRATNDTKSINEIFSTVFITQLLFAFLIVIISFFLPEYILQYSIFNISTNLEITFKIALQFGILLFSLKLIEQVIFAYFKGFERFDISAKLSIFSKFMMIIIQLITIYLTPSLDNVFENSFIYLFILLVGEILFIKYQNKNINFFKDYKIKRLYEVFHFTKWSWIISVIGTASSQVDRWVVASIANMTILGYYSVALLVFNNIHSIIASSMGWVFPKVSKEADEEKIYNYYLLLQAILFLGSFLISYILITFDNIFLYWLKEDSFNHSIEYIKNLLVLIPLYSMGIIPFYIVKGTGNIKYNFYSDITTFTIRISLMLLLYKFYGINGVIIAIGVSGLFLVTYLSFIVKRNILKKFDIKMYQIIALSLIYIIFNFTTIWWIKILIFLLLLYVYINTFLIVLKKVYKGK